MDAADPINPELLFLGTGTSAGVPMIGCDCAVCTSPDPRDKRTRPSVVITYGPAERRTRVLIDTTPELRLQALATDVRSIDAVVFTHAHADHIMGLDDVRRFNTIKQGPLDVWASPATHEGLRRVFGYAFREPDPAMKLFRPHLVPRDITGPFVIAGVTWTPVPLLHGKMEVNGYRVGGVAYCTDVSEIPEPSFDLLRELDVLVLGALQHTKHSTHFTLEEAVQAATRIGAKRTYFTHIAHGLGDAETNAALPPSMQLSHDGLRVQ